jgi:elongation factor P--(R)-beta-lysine ligase
LLAAGSGSIYQICKVFRAGEAGRLHNPEFTMIEWYRIGADHHQLMDDVAVLVTETLDGFRRLAAPEKFAYGDAFQRHAACDPHTATSRDLAAAAKARGLDVSGLTSDDVDGWRDLLLTHVVEPELGRDRLTFLYDYPATAAALARIRPGNPPVAERFELYLDGVELANGFHELADATEQRQRFEHDLRLRAAHDRPTIPMDTHLLAALTHGLPDCSGVALGFDRLVMAAGGARAIAEVIAFPFERA